MTTLTNEDLKHFTGDLVRFRNAINPIVIYTPGIKHVADVGEAYWLVDAIAIWIGTSYHDKAAEADERLRDMIFWTLTVQADKSALLEGRAESGEDPAYRLVIPYTDFPLETIDIWSAFDGEYWTVYLPNEH